MKTILVAVDLSSGSSNVLKEAVNLAEDLSAKVVLLHVIPPVSSALPVGSSMEMVSVPLPLSVEEIAEVKSRLDQLAASFASPKVTMEVIVKEALPVEEIKHQIEVTGASMLIVGSHGHGGLYHLFNGSVVTELLKQASKPVLVVPARN